MYINTIISLSPDAVMKGIASRVKERRLEKDLTQKVFAKKAGVGYDAYRKFENTGEITLRNLVLCAIVLDSVEEFSNLFSQKSYTSIDQLLETKNKKQRKRASRNE
ncbi:helix-turn-helix transcriptional regulator [Paludibacteraceae bacterium OttesenSCG-928-F17]|nr:helix-turn-helix transcriptional regulator [Paludibacteraceae bacterium OttesenSCG-928-F17]